jgi:tetratricopeptide (TPR) repeat protein
MRPSLALICICASTLASAASGQCTPAIQRLIGDGKAAEARAEMEAVVKRSPNDDAALECLGRVLIALDKAGDAVPVLEKAVKLNDKSSSHHLWLGNAIGDQAENASKIKQPFMARRIKSEFERAVALDPTNIDARHGLVQFYAIAPGVMGGSMDKARAQIAEITRINPLRGHLEMAWLLNRDNDIAGVEREYIAALAAAPDSTIAYLNLGGFYQNTQKWNEAFAIYDRLLAKQPDLPSVHFQIGRTAALSGMQLDRGERELKGWLASPPKDAPTITLAGAHHRLGMIYEKQGKKDLARAEYLEAVRINPNNEDAKKALAALK